MKICKYDKPCIEPRFQTDIEATLENHVNPGSFPAANDHTTAA